MESSSKPPFLLCSKLHTGSYRIRRYQQSHKKENKMSRIADITGHKASSQVPKTHVLTKIQMRRISISIFQLIN